MICLVLASTCVSVSFMFMTHPVSLVISVLAQTIMICSLSLLILQTAWFAIIIFLIYLGGVMVLFVYISSLASNENFMVNFKSWALASSTIIGVSLTIMHTSKKSSTTPLDLNSLNPVEKLYSTQMLSLTLMTMIYLLFTLIVVVEMIKYFKAPLRSSH